MSTAPNIIPTLRYRDAPAAISFLEKAFGLRAQFVVPGPDGTIAHAQLVYGNGMVMLASTAEAGDEGRLVVTQGPGWVYVIVDDVEAHHAVARDAGAEIIQPPRDEDYGGSGYSALDPEGNVWSFGTYAPELG